MLEWLFSNHDRGRLLIKVYFLALKQPYIAKSVAEFQGSSRLYGMPRSIVSDRDKVFTSQYWTEYFRLQ